MPALLGGSARCSVCAGAVVRVFSLDVFDGGAVEHAVLRASFSSSCSICALEYRLWMIASPSAAFAVPLEFPLELPTLLRSAFRNARDASASALIWALDRQTRHARARRALFAARDVIVLAAVLLVVDLDELVASLLEFQAITAQRLASNRDLVLAVRDA